jgi:dTDP-4-dehydrorhamnose 3,5-epimerase
VTRGSGGTIVPSALDLPGLALLRAKRADDDRGWFCELFSMRGLEELGISTRFLQDNMSCSAAAATLRGLHAQRAPMAQAKLVTVTVGAVFDVVVDCRKGSPTFGQHRSVVLSARGGEMLYVPAGFCHGFLTLDPGTTVFYKVDNYYSPAHETGLRWNDPDLAIAWPLDGAVPILSEKDRALPPLSELVPL